MGRPRLRTVVSVTAGLRKITPNGEQVETLWSTRSYIGQSIQALGWNRPGYFYQYTSRDAFPSTVPQSNVEACHDGGPGSVSNMCPYGSHTSACGVRRFAFEYDKSGPDGEPDDSCASAKNGVCEDGLMWSYYPPGQNPCQPGTDTSDCGWRAPRRVARQLTAASDDCPNRLADVSDWAMDTCGDHTDYMGFNPRVAMHSAVDLGQVNTCGRGQDTRRCKAADGHKRGHGQQPRRDADRSDAPRQHHLRGRQRPRRLFQHVRLAQGCSFSWRKTQVSSNPHNAL